MLQRISLIAVLWCACWPRASEGQVDSELAAIRTRLEAIERENWDRQQTIAQRLSALEINATGQKSLNSPALVVDGEQAAHVRSIVEEYLAERDAQTRAAEQVTPTDSGAGSEGTEVGTDLSMSARWNHGLELSTKDKAFRLHVGGRWQLDVPWFCVDPSVQNNLPGDVQYHDGIDLRRAFLRLDGRMYEQIDFMMEYNLVSGFRERNAAAFTDINVTAINDMWLQLTDTPIGNIRIGNQKQAIAFEHLVSSRFLPFLERSFNQDAFSGGLFNGYAPGISLSDNFEGDRGSWNIGFYKPTPNIFGFSTNDGDYAMTARLTGLPIYECEGRQVLHWGVSARHATTFDDRVRFRTRDALRTGTVSQWPIPADVTTLGETYQFINAELVALQGPWTFQAEWLVSLTHDAQQVVAGVPVGPHADVLTYHGGYVQLLYFLTGESDRYVLNRMALDRVVPFENFFWVAGDESSHCLGRGAWQVGTRYNYLDLNDQGINGGQLHNLTAALSWFWNPNTKWQFNYIATYRDVSQTPTFPSGSGWIHGWGMRFAQDF